MIYTRYPHPARAWDAIAPLTAGMKGYRLDNKGASYKSEAMDSLRLPGVVVKTKKNLSPDQKADLRAVLRQKVGGDARENAIIVSGEEVAVDMLNPMKDFDWEAYSDLNETRICMVFGVPPIVIGSWVGLKNSPWSNTAEAKRWMYENTMVSVWSMFADSLTRALVPPELRATLRVNFDLTGIKELRMDEAEQWQRASKGWNDGFLTRAEARELIGYDYTDADNVFKYTMRDMLLPYPDTFGTDDTSLTPAEQEAGVAAQREGRE
jgi:HK97 family phage portal protein